MAEQPQNEEQQADAAENPDETVDQTAGADDAQTPTAAALEQATAESPDTEAGAPDPTQPDASADAAPEQPPASEPESGVDAAAALAADVADTFAQAASESAAEAADQASAFAPPDLSNQPAADAFGNIELLDDVELDVRVELGQTEMYIEDVLRLGVGSVVELDRLAGDPVDVYVNDRLVARGEVLVLNDSFCVRVNDIVSPIPELEHEKA